MKTIVLHCVETLDINAGGPSRSIPNICASLDPELFYSYIITHDSANPNFQAIDKKTTSLQLVPRNNSLFSRFCSSEFVSSIDRIDAHVYHAHNLWSLSIHAMAKFCRKKNKKYIISPRGTLEPWALNNKKLKKKLALLTYQFEDLKFAFCIHATSEEEVFNIRNLGLNNPIALIPNGVNIEKYPLKLSPFNTNKRSFLFMSRIDPKKGIELLLDAWVKVNNPMLELFIAGDGEKEYVNKVKSLISNLDPSLNVTFVGPKFGREKISLFHTVDIFILPTYSENFGMVIAEAMCCGLPVITTKGTPWKCLEDQNAGYWINIDVGSIEESINRIALVSNQELLEMGQRGRKIITNNYSIESTSQKFNQLYSWVSNPIQSNIPSFIVE